jgi:Prokaryotic N-terminal methylation motif
MKIALRGSRRCPSSSRVRLTSRRRGIALIEVIVAMVLLSIMLSSLGPLIYSVSRSTRAVTGNAYRNGVLMQEVNRLMALPYDSMPVGVTTFSVSTAPYPHSRTVSVSQPVVNLKLVKIVVTPVSSAYKPDSVQFDRTKARTSKYLCTTCQ